MKFRIVLLCMLLACVGTAIYLYQSLQKPAFERSSAKVIKVKIARESSLSGAVDALARERLIETPFVAKIVVWAYSKFTDKQLRRGTVFVSGDQSQFDVLMGLFYKSQEVKVTFPEGISLQKYAAIVSEKVGCDSAEFMRLATNDSLCKAWNIPAKSLEGYFAPDTYNFFKYTSEMEIIQRLFKQQEAIWTKNFAELAEKLPMTKAKILTLASIVEAETPVPAERPRVSGVYMNRLKRGMKLQADPTVQYALGGIQRRLLYRDLEVDNPYNTYRYEGLPPAPINSPSKTSILSAIAPENHEFLYFVAAGDGSNTHVFSKNEVQHQRAVQKYRAARRLNL